MAYHHTQTGVVIIALIGLVVLFIFGTMFALDLFLPMEVVVAVLLLVVGYLFSSLTVEIAGGSLTCRFGPGLIRKEILLSEITDARAVTNTFMTGWGIRWLPGHYVLWNVSGFRAVELTLTSGKRFRIGTDEPDTLVQAIQSNISTGR
jgi:hypothetical protein